MLPSFLVKSPGAYRPLLRFVLFAGIAVLTGWYAFTGSSARLEQPMAQQQASTPPGTQPAAAKLDRNFGNLPISFEVNRGQTNDSVNYLARGSGYNIFLTPTEAVLVFPGASESAQGAAGNSETATAEADAGAYQSQLERARERRALRSPSESPTVVKMRLEGANPQPRAIEGVAELPGRVNYLLGTDSSKWRTDIHTYRKVAYRDLYAGVDLVYYGTGQQLEYDLVVAPGADTSNIKLRYEGAESVRLDSTGGLVLKTRSGELRQQKPLIYEQGADGVRKEISGSYVLKSDGGVSFKIAKYDRRKSLIIDPVLSYLSLVNARGRGFAIAVDPAGFAYFTGSLDPGDNLPATPGAYQVTGGGGQDVFVTKLNQTGNEVVYSTYLGGSGDEDAYGIALDQNGNAYITGYANPGFPTTPGAYKTTLAAGSDAFVAKLNSTGSGLVYATYFGGLNYEECDGIKVNAAGNAYIVGITESVDLPTTAGAFQTTNGGGADAFVAGFDATGSNLLYATYLGGNGFDFGLSLALDAANNIYFVGQTSSLSLPSVLQPASGTDRGLFKTTSNGATWSLNRTGLTNSFVNALAVAPNTPATVYLGAQGGVAKSVNGAASWTATGTISGGNVQSLAVDPTNANIVYAGSNYGVFKSTNGGVSWTAMNTGLTVNQVPFIVRSLAIDRNATATVYAATAGGGMFKSTDGGGTWTAINSGITNFGMRAVLIDPSNSATIYSLNNTRVNKSTNGGATWTQIVNGLPSVNTYRSLVIDPITPATLYVGGGSGVFKTTNGGTLWSAVNNGLLLPYTDNLGRLPFVVSLAVDPVAPNTLYAGAANAATATGAFPLAAVLKSIDGGANWTAQTNGFNNINAGVSALAVDPSNPAVIYTGTSGDAEAFIARLTPGNPTPLFTSYLGGSRGDIALGISLDSAGNADIVGRTSSANFPATAGALQTTLSGAADAFVAKLNPNNSVGFVTYLGGSRLEDGHGIATDAAGNIYVAGRTTSSDFPTTAGSFQTKIGNPGDATKADMFVARLNPAGNSLSYASYLGGGGDEAVSPFGLQLLNTIGLDNSGNAYLVGLTSDPNTFPVFDYVNVNNLFGATATFVAKVSSDSSSYSITGRLTDGSNNPIAGVFVEAASSQGFFRGANSDSQGFYSIISLPPGDYTVTPGRNDGSGKHYLYTPPSRSVLGLNSDQTADFTGTQVFDIDGQVTSSVVPGLGIFDVTVTLSGSAAASTVTDADGNFSFKNLSSGNYTVTPSKSGFTFAPVNLSYTNLSADAFASFTTASTTFFTVSGRVATSADVGIANATISMLVVPQQGNRAISVQTDVNGNYSIPNLQAGGNYTFIASKRLFSFLPQAPTFPSLAANQTLNFTASAVTGLIGKIALTKIQPATQGISVMNADGSSEVDVTNAIDDGATWSPDGTRIAFSRQGSGLPEDIYTMNADGTGVTRITNTPLSDVFPSWSPDATQFTFTYGDCNGTGGAPDVYVMDANGANRHRLTNTLVADGISDWSPGGSSIAFIRGNTVNCDDAENSADVFAMDPLGGNLRTLANNVDGESRPAYSPDGSRIAYFRGSNSSPGAALYVMNADGTGQTRISPDLQIDDTGKPTWSPDGSKIAFAANLIGTTNISQIFVVNADGTGLAQLTNDDGLSRLSPSWQHYSISGQVTGNTTGLPITMTLAGTLTRVTQTDANGRYVFGNLTPGGNYSVTPVSAAFGFSPAKTDISNLVGNQIANFALVPQVIPAPTPALADDFGAGQRDPSKWNLGTQTQPLTAFDPQVSVVQQNGKLVITPRTLTDGLHYNGYVSVNSFDFNNATATVEIAQIATNGADTIFAIGSDLENFSRFVVRAGSGAPGVFRKDGPRDAVQLIFQVKAGGQLTSVSIPYDPVLHRFMRFRHVPVTNSIAFETSPNNVDFTVQKEIPLVKGVSALTTELSAGTSSPTNPGQAVFDNFQLVTNTVQFSSPGISVNEGQGSAELVVTRSGDASTPAAVEYVSFDDSAHQSSKYILATGKLSFAAGETTKSFKVLIIDNNLVDGNQTLYLNLADSFGAGLNSPGRTALTILDNDTTPPTTNPLDNPDAQFFVREHYYDFLNREPDPSGFAFWTDQITSCGNDRACVDYKKVNVSAAYFLSIEFQQSGYLVYRFYNAALDRANGLPRYLEFLRDTQTIGRGVVVGAPGWEALLEANKADYAEKFSSRADFVLLYPTTLTPVQYVDALFAHAGIVPDAAQRQAAIDEFNNPTGARGRALRRVVENPTLYAREFNRAFVLAQYFGYLRRNPDDAPDFNLAGYNFWLNKLNQFNGNFVNADMVKSFIVSGEYKGRFGP
jgi:Tol biopolymer transport system component